MMQSSSWMLENFEPNANQYVEIWNQQKQSHRVLSESSRSLPNKSNAIQYVENRNRQPKFPNDLKLKKWKSLLENSEFEPLLPISHL